MNGDPSNSKTETNSSKKSSMETTSTPSTIPGTLLPARSQKSIWIAGVCGGLSERFGGPSWIWRTAFLICGSLYGLGLLAYLILWKLMPQSIPENDPRLFWRRIDWITLGITTAVSFFAYWYTIAPDVTLEDSGELAVASMYAGVPHPPGYPVWTLYTYLFTKVLPFSNIAWRVAMSSAVAAALACGLIGLMVSRGSSMLLEALEEFSSIPRSLENSICAVSGVVAGLLMAFNGFMWSQAVIVEVYTLSVLSLTVMLALLMRWVHRPEDNRFLLWAFFVAGICFNNHQTLIVAVIGVHVMTIFARPSLGRDLFVFNSMFYFVGLLLSRQGFIAAYQSNPPLFTIFHVVGLASAITAFYLWIKTEKILTDWKTAVGTYGAWVLGALLYFYMPLASMSNPPMNWGYPRTEEGFFHAITRGQYEQANPTSDFFTFLEQIVMYVIGAIEEFNPVFLLVGLIPFLFLHRLARREKSWIIGLSAIFICLAVLLLILLNPQPDRQSRELNRVFFTASHVIIAMGIGYGISILGAWIAALYRPIRYFLLWGSAVAAGIALVYATKTFESTQFPLLRGAAILSSLLPVTFLALVLYFKESAPLKLFLALFSLMPIQSVLSHWSDNEQRGHLFGYWFGHDMFSPPFKNSQDQPIYPEMAKDAILFGGTDPGRFNPTYMIFCESFIPESKKPRDPDFDRRDVYLITQNALADGTYLSYIRAHYNNSTQVNTPFFQELLRPQSMVERNRTNFLARAVAPLDRYFTRLGDQIEKDRRAGSSFLTADHFIELEAFCNQLTQSQPSAPLAQFLMDHLSDKTKKMIQENSINGTLAKNLAADLNKVLDGPSIYTEERFQSLELSSRTQRFVQQSPTNHMRIRLNRILLEEAYPTSILRSKAGVYPDLEIHTPTIEESQTAFSDYVYDAQERYLHDQQNPTLPPKVRPGEIIKIVDGRVQVAGQVAVMAINAILTKIIFDKNPDHEFYLEESFPLDWMYPYLTPHGIIMKINRETVPEFTEEILQKDHEFWTQYSSRLIGNWIDYDTPVADVCNFARRVYLNRDFTGYQGNRTFIRDDNAQKSFSKLRSSIGGLYLWRMGTSTNLEERNRLIRETGFALKQAFAFCPYSPEAMFRYTSFLVDQGELKDALLVAETSYEFDQDNQQVYSLVEQIRMLEKQNFKGNRPSPALSRVQQLPDLENQYATNSTNVQIAFNLVSAYLQNKQSNQAFGILSNLTFQPKPDPSTLLSVAQAYAQLGQIPPLESVFIRLTEIMPDNAEAYYDLAGVQTAIGKFPEALNSLKTAIKMSNDRLSKEPNASNLATQAASDPRFGPLRAFPEFLQMVSPQ